jgi:phage tail P2-like protein
MIDLRDTYLTLLDFVPESIITDSEIVALSVAIDPELRSVGASIIEAVILPNIGQLPEPILDELAWAFRLNELQLWDDADIDGKRALLVNIFAIRKKSGTRFAVRRIFDLLSVIGTLTEWWEEDTPTFPFTYKIQITATDVAIVFATLLQISELTHRFAPARAALAELSVAGESRAPVVLYPALMVGRDVTIPFGGP